MKANSFIAHFHFSQQAVLTPTFSIGCSPLGYPEEQACNEL